MDSKGAALRKLIHAPDILICPGVYDGYSARMAAKYGFRTAVISGAGVSESHLGWADKGIMGYEENVRACRALADCSDDLLLQADADTGYGNAVNVHFVVRGFEAAGMAAVMIEDQVWPKRCGHMRDKRVVERGEYLERIRAAVEARGEHDFFIVARSDAEAVIGLDEAIDRVSAAHALGADACFVEAPGSVEQLAEIGRRTPGPRVANMIEGGKTPLLPKQQLAELGFQLILYPLTGLFGAAAAMHQLCTKLMADGSSAGAEDQLMDFASFNELIGVEERLELVRRLQEVEE